MSESVFKKALVGVLLTLLTAITFGIVWFFFIGPATPIGFGWYLFSFAAGLTMIVLPCTLPLAFVIVPLSMGRGALKGFMIAIAFGLGVAITLSLYGVLAAVLGKVAIGTLAAPLETVKNWLYFIAGAFAYLFALGELGLINFRMPSYTGAFPAFIQKQQDVLKALLLGLFLGNIGVGCPHPATPVLLTRIAAEGDIFYGWSLFFIHALGRVLPLLFLAILGILGINALKGLVAKKEKIERATGWAMVFVAGFILVLGLFGHDWWVLSGQHTFLEQLTQEERFVGLVAQKLGVEPPHEHGLPPPDHTGLFGLPLQWGTWALLFLWILPFWWHYSKTKRGLSNAILLSLLLIAIFGYILPNRFLQTVRPHDMMNEIMREEMEGHDEDHGANFYHEESEVKEGIAVNFNISPIPTPTSKKAKLDFFVNRKPGNVGIPESELQVQHEQKMHVIGVRSDLNEFFHIHPAPEKDNQAVFSVQHVFGKPGDYKIWSEVKYRNEDHAFGHPLIKVSGTGPVFELQKEITRNQIIGTYQVEIAYSGVYAERENNIDFIVKTLEGGNTALGDYLGEKMHLVMISEDLREFIHAHPISSKHHEGLLVPLRALAHGIEVGEEAIEGENHVSFSMPFTKPGFYKLFAQFKPQNADLGPEETLVAEFWLEIKVKPIFANITQPNWWRNLVVSLALIFGLGWLTKRYLKVQEIKPESNA